MRLVLQRVTEASVTVDGEIVGRIGAGLLVLVGISEDDEGQSAHATMEWACRKLLGIRLWEADGKAWAQSVTQAKLGVLLVSQFTLHAQLKGNKPDFHRAMKPELSKPFWETFVERVKASHKGLPVQTGTFGAKMSVSLVNDGPVTIVLDSAVDGPAANHLTPPPTAKPAPTAKPTTDAKPAPATRPPVPPPAAVTLDAAVALLVRAPGAFALLRRLEERGLRLAGLKSIRDEATGELAVAAALRTAGGGSLSAAAVQRMLRNAAAAAMEESNRSRAADAASGTEGVLRVTESWQDLFAARELVG
jgi:D-tyrosyl-tRNA(Tyr) deacylase